MKRHSMSLIMREMLIEMTMRYHLTSVRMAIINKSTNKCCQGCGEGGPLVLCLWNCKLVQPLCETIWSVLEKIKNVTTIWPKNYISAINTRNSKTLIQKDICTPMFTAVLFTTAKIWKQPKCPSICEWMKKKWCIYKWNMIQP